MVLLLLAVVVAAASALVGWRAAVLAAEAAAWVAAKGTAAACQSAAGVLPASACARHKAGAGAGAAAGTGLRPTQRCRCHCRKSYSWKQGAGQLGCSLQTHQQPHLQTVTPAPPEPGQPAWVLLVLLLARCTLYGTGDLSSVNLVEMYVRTGMNL